MPRFVLLYHDCPTAHPRPSHFDLMLERSGALRTWAISKFPDSVAVERVAAEQLPDHRLAYLDYEGPVSGDRGTVTRVDSGTFATVKESSDAWEFELSGQAIHGHVTLERTYEQASAWQLTFAPSDAIES